MQALNHNQQLKQQAYLVALKKQQSIASGSALWPSIDASLNANRRKDTLPSRYSNNSSLGLDLRYELDIWGKLSANQRQANLSYLAEQARFAEAKQQLEADVAVQWYLVAEAQQLLALYQRRVDNSQQNLATIASGYRRGLTSALDVYLSRNELNTESARVAQQHDLHLQRLRQLERLLGGYPAGALVVKAALPLPEEPVEAGFPAQLVSRKPALQASWYRLLATDAGLAYAHKQRFPSINLTASLSDNGANITDLLSGAPLAWSLLGSLSAPIFNGGRLEANEEQARLVVKQSEQAYLDDLYNAFASVENALSAEQSLQQRYQLMLKAEENALAAQSLSFEQYQKGLVNYTTVLDAQKRSYDAQSTVIQLKQQLLANRIQLHLALGVKK